jgi:hypothetical protein
LTEAVFENAVYEPPYAAFSFPQGESMKRLAYLLMLPLLAWGDLMPITPVTAGTTTISCTSSSAATALPATISQQSQIELQNPGTVAIFVEVGISTATAAVATGYPVLAGQSKVITVSPTITHIACIVAVTTTTLYVTIGRGN